MGNNTLSPYARTFDCGNSNWNNVSIEYNVMFLRMTQNFCNDKLMAQGYLFLNDVYERLGLEKSKDGQVFGWIEGSSVDFGILDPINSDAISSGGDSITLDFNVVGYILDKAFN